jgi:hypothetical protein
MPKETPMTQPSKESLERAREIVKEIAANWDDHLRHKGAEFVAIESERIALALDEARAEVKELEEALVNAKSALFDAFQGSCHCCCDQR